MAVENTGERAGKTVVQIYASRADSVIDRPARWLAAFDVVRMAAGERREVELTVPARAFAHWDDAWNYEPGAFTLHLGESAAVDLDTASVVLLRRG